jgi:hypothetical protein
MISNGINPVPSPNGLGDLAADGVRNVPNSIIAQTLAAVGGNPANLPGYNFTPFQAATGILRSKLLGGVPLSFADVTMSCHWASPRIPARPCPLAIQ